MTDRKDRITKELKREAQPSRARNETVVRELGGKLKRLAGFRAKVKTEFKKEEKELNAWEGGKG
jgi:hypothetical protein